MQPLPIDPLLPEVVERLRRSPALVLVAEPGAGKTTRVPRALLDAGLAGAGEVVVLEPRRLAARLAARRVAQERGERLGELVGYQVRFEEVAGPRTRLRFLTEGLLTRRLLADPSLGEAGVVVLDEFHERSLQADLALALLRALQKSHRPELRLVVMSATLEAEPIARFLGGAPVLAASGRPFEVAVEHLVQPDDRPLEVQVASALRRLLADGLEGNVLVFLPGAREIRRAMEAVAPIAARHDLAVLPLHGDLSAAEQDRAVEPGPRRKVILSTNVAETSVTIEGVAAVIDSGLARVAGHSPWSGMPTLTVAPIARASAIQRAGRAGRTGPGRCLRLYTRHDFEGRPEHQAPEVQRVDLSEAALLLYGAGVRDLGGFGWFEAPRPAALEAAEGLLRLLGALEADGALSALGRRMLRIPAHPRAARVLLEAAARGRGEDGALLAALLGEREIRLEARGPSLAGRPRTAAVSGASDLIEALEAFREAEGRGFAEGALRSLGLEAGAVHAVDRVRRSLARIPGPEASEARPAPAAHLREQAAKQPLSSEPLEDQASPLLLSILSGFPDRVARRRSANRPELVLAGGGSATLSDTSVVRDADYLVAVDAEERGRGGALVRVASAIEPAWLLDLFPDQIADITELVWNEEAERVEGVSRLAYGGLALEESRTTRVDPVAAARLLAEAALRRGPERFCDPQALARLLARLRFASESAPGTGIPALGDAEMRSALEALCAGRTSFAELRQASLLQALLARLSPAQRSALDTLAPERVRLPGGRQPEVHYEPGRPPWIESRLQDFFGMTAGPTAGAVPIVLHLLAPNQRAVQVTTDLSGFWNRHYPAIRRELSRKYPKHSWPEDPRTARPPAAGPRRR